jgi:hypothetical protein
VRGAARKQDYIRTQATAVPKGRKMFLLFLLRRLSSNARITVGAASVAAGVTAELFIRIGVVFAVVGIVFLISGVRAKRRERVNHTDVEPPAFAQISE